MIKNILIITYLFTIVFAGPALHADKPDPKPTPEKKPAAEEKTADKTSTKDEEEKKEDKKKEKEKDRFFAVTGGIVHTVTNGDLFNVTILSKNGKIIEMGTSVELPEDTEVLDASSYHIYPGLIAVSSGNILGAQPPDDTTNVYSYRMAIALAGGITTAVSGETAAKLSFGHVDDMIIKRDVFKKLNYSSREPDARRKLRAKFEKVRQYIRDLEKYQEKKKIDPDTEEPKKDWLKGEYDTVYKLIRRETTAVMDANGTGDLLAICDLVNRYGIAMVVRGAVEGWTVASEMARAGLSAVVTPRRRVFSDDRVNRPNGSSIENAAILYNHGVPIAIIPAISAITTWGVAGRDLLHLNMEAAFAVRGGLPEEAAIRAITIDAARILGIDHRVGSIEVGKDADFDITDGDLLHYMTLTRWTVVNGRIAYDKQKESFFEHIRPDGNLDAPPPNDYWPRSLGDDQ